jgi:hypothetical protein
MILPETYEDFFLSYPQIFSTIHENALGGIRGFSASAHPPISTAWPAANRAIYVPVLFPLPAYVRSFWIYNGDTVGGTIDIGFCTYKSYTKVFSTGLKTCAGTDAIQTFTLAKPQWIGPGRFYYVISKSTIDPVFSVQVYLGVPIAQFTHEAQEDSAHPIPDTGTPVSITSAFLPIAGFTGMGTM